MQYFKDCTSCELLIIGAMIVAIFVIDHVVCSKRKWGCNPDDAKWGKK